MSFTTYLSERLRPYTWSHSKAARPLTKRRPQRDSFRPCLEGLEERWVPSTIRVNHDFNVHAAADSVNQHGTLDWAVANAKDGDTILLTADVQKTGITLTHGELIFRQQNLTITTDSGQPLVTISGNHLSRVFEVAPGASVTLSNVYITGGDGMAANLAGNADCEGSGGGILVDDGGALTISGTTVAGNSASSGGGIWSVGTLTLANHSSVSGSVTDYAGGIANIGGTLTVSDSTISGDYPIFTGFGTATISNSTISASQGFFGVAIDSSFGKLTVSSHVYGTLIYGNGSGGSLTVTDHSTVSGGIYDYGSDGTVTVKDSTVCGGIYEHYHEAVVVTGSTVSGGIYTSYLGTVTISDSIVDFIVGSWIDGLGNTIG